MHKDKQDCISQNQEKNLMWLKRFICQTLSQIMHFFSLSFAGLIISPIIYWALSDRPQCVAIFQHTNQYNSPLSRSATV